MHVQTVRRWARAGVPNSRLATVAGMLADRAAVKRAEAGERAKVRRLIAEARQKGVLERSKPRGKERFGGPRAVGQKLTFHLNQYLAPETLTAIEEAVSGAPKGPNYIVSVTAVEAGITGKRRGYQGAIVKSLGREAENIAFGTVITSGRHTSRRKALASLFGKLRDAIEDADSLIYLTSGQVFSYAYKDTLTSRRLRSLAERGK